MTNSRKYIKVIIPLKINNTATYSIPEDLQDEIYIGSRVRVNFSNKIYPAVVETFIEEIDFPESKVKNILSTEDLPPISSKELMLWRNISQYYMCTIGEVFKATYTTSQNESAKKTKEKKSTTDSTIKGNISTTTHLILPTLSESQTICMHEIKRSFAENKTALLKGVTGSGKTEIYINLVAETLAKGKSVLYMLPEIAISRQLSSRFEDVFGDMLLVYHSKQTLTEKKRIINLLTTQNNSSPHQDNPHLVLGLRSSIFLPFQELGLIIIDEEHDSSYKQDDPAPRYNGRDVAIMLGKIHGSDILMGSATPSFESIYNSQIKKYNLIQLNQKYHGTIEPEVQVIDTIRSSKRKEMQRSFSKELLDQIKEAKVLGEQVVIFRNRRAYSPIVQCSNCGFIPKCIHCNVHLSYHKFSNSLSCHYCESKIKYNTICPECASPTLLDKGAGTEKLEEELKAILPEIRIARFDADITKSKKEEQRILKAFAKQEIDVLIGTQMISKGFDFQNVTIAAIINADTLIAQQDFRADEKSIQLLSQLRGRAGRRAKRGKLIIQTGQPKNPIFKEFACEIDLDKQWNNTIKLLKERYDFNYPPFTRAIKIVFKEKKQEKLEEFANKLAEMLPKWGITNFNGPFAPPIDLISGQRILHLWIWLNRDNELIQKKITLQKNINKLTKEMKFYGLVNIDVDPY